MELTKELIESHQLSDDVVKAISSYGAEQIANVKKEFEGKANTDAEGILTGVAKSIRDKFGVNAEREQGEKYGDYLSRVSQIVVSTKQSEIDKVKSDYEEKIKGVKGAETLRTEYEQLQSKLDEVQKKYADYDEVKAKAQKADEYSEQLSGLKLDQAFTKVRPVFPETANKYEVDAKWKAWKESVLKEYEIELVEGKPMAISKENQYKQKELSELLASDENIKSLLEKREQGGLNAKEREKELSIEGVPFKLPVNPTPQERQDAIKAYLTNDLKLNAASQDYAKKFAELNQKILNGGQKV
ncbi:hypothetical protein EP331_00455 [bacterium]|nr:MAG: hypothetical protein EP331_00455 [bacterium]